MMNSNRLYLWVYRTSYIYLVLPFIIFCLGWLNIFVGLLLAAFVIVSTYLIFKLINKNTFQTPPLKPKLFLVIVLFLGLWLLLSGVGGYAFQNIDHHWRNALFRDLINYQWPVIYGKNELAVSNPTPQMLVYYIGFWLPAALIGKLSGWEIANLVLFLWAWIGLILTGLHLLHHYHTRSIWPIILLIFFSGMDIVGIVIRQRMAPLPGFTTLWPPIQHLENWAYPVQFSSTTTQLFWVFNQALPCWITIALLVTNKDRRYVAFTWALCFFLSPLPAIGILPYIFVDLALDIKAAFTKTVQGAKGLLQAIASDLSKYFNFVNLVGASSILLVAFFYFAQNTLDPAPSAPISLIRLFLFPLIEGAILWILLLPLYRDNAKWYVVGIMLVFSPLLLRGDFDYGMRISLPTLFMLMLGVGEGLRRKAYPYRTFLLLLMMIGAVTALFEINRSILRTVEYYFRAETIFAERWDPELTSNYSIDEPLPTEKDHPDTVVADYYKSLTTVKSQFVSSYLGDIETSFFYEYLAKK